jgi:CheY-like chemotaxis protein
MDCQMPVLDGWEAARRWCEFESGQGLRRLPVIALTANAVVGECERCLEAVMDDYLAKPFELSELTAKMRRHVAPA